MVSEDLAPQSVLQGRYHIAHLVGRGGMGAVYKASDTRNNNRLVAIKEMRISPNNQGAMDTAQDRFEREAAILRRLQHPNLPRVYGSFIEQGRSYLVMDFIEGQSLNEMLQASSSGRLPVQDVVQYAIQLCDVLAYLHRQQPPVIFRDLKPSNVMVTAQGKVYLVDFGIARNFKAGRSQDTEAFVSVGYASPEQFGTGQTTPRSDLYSLGATLYHCLTGKNPALNTPTPFHFTDAQQENMLIPSDLSKLVHWLVATNEDQRPASAKNVRDALLTITTHAASITGNLQDDFYDEKTAYAAHFSGWARQQNEVVRKPGTWLSAVLLPWLASIYAWLRINIFLPHATNVTQVSRRIISLLRIYAQNVGSDVRALSFRTPIWTWSFALWFWLLLLAVIGTSFYLLLELQLPLSFVALVFCVLLGIFLLYLLGQPEIQDPLIRSILIVTVLSLLLSAFTLQGMSDAAEVIQEFTLGQAFSAAILICTGLSLWRRNIWSLRLSLALISSMIALFLFIKGRDVFAPLFFHANSFADIVSGGSAIALLVIAAFELMRFQHPLAWIDRLFVFLLATAALGLQFVYGMNFILHTPLAAMEVFISFDNVANVATINLCVALIPALIASLWLFWSPGSLIIGRVAVFCVGLLCVGLQGYLAPMLELAVPAPYTPAILTTKVVDVLRVNQLVAYSLLVSIVLLIRRLSRDFAVLERFVLLIVALVGLLLQYAAWQPFDANSVADQSEQFYAILLNQLGANLFIFLLACYLLGFVIHRCLLIVGKFSWGTRVNGNVQAMLLRVVKRLEHVLMVAMTMATTTLLHFFGPKAWLLSLTFGFADWHISVSLLVTIMFAGLIILCLFRVARSFGKVDRWILLCNVVVYSLFLFKGIGGQHITILSDTQQWLANPGFTLPSPFAALGIFAAASISLVWLKRFHLAEDRALCWLLFGLAFLCTLVQWFSSVLTFFAVVLLVAGLLLASRIELVRYSSPATSPDAVEEPALRYGK